jgi:hypothetical protein
MDDGLIQFLVIAFFIIVTMMDGAARKRRKQAQSSEHLPESLLERNRLQGAEDDLGEAAESPEPVALKDVWEEIATLARGEVPGREADPVRGPATVDADSMLEPDSTAGMEVWTAPQQEIPQMRTPAAEDRGRAERSTRSYGGPGVTSLTKVRSADLQSGYSHPDQVASHEKHAHEKHTEVAVPSRPLPAKRPHEFVLHSPELAGRPQKELRRAQKRRGLLSGVRGGAKNSLREAIILAEVLSPPVVLRDPGWKPQF